MSELYNPAIRFNLRLNSFESTTNSTSAQRRFAYDRWGNRSGVWNATSGGTQIQSVSLVTSFQGGGSAPTNRIGSVTNSGVTVNYSYDANGNVTNDGVHSYTSDAENRVVSVDSGTTATYAYDPQNRRVKKVVSSTTTHYVWQGNQVLAEHNGSTGALLINYTYSGNRMVAKTESGTTRYFLSDKLSARVVLDTSGNVVGRQAHLPFGEDLNATGTTDKHKMTSYERDSETGNDYAVNRGYASSIGRFNQADPYKASGGAATPQSWNRYSYVKNDPANATDPLGLMTSMEFVCVINPIACESNDLPGGSPGPDSEGRWQFGFNKASSQSSRTYSCKVTLKFKFLLIDPITNKDSYHAYILLEQSYTIKGTPFDLPRELWRGGPTLPTPFWGKLLVTTEEYKEGALDWEKAGDRRHKNIDSLKFPGTCDRFKRHFEATLDRINARNLTYSPEGHSNSNGTAYTFLHEAGLLGRINVQDIWDVLGPNSELLGWGELY